MRPRPPRLMFLGFRTKSLEWTWGLDHRHLDEHLQKFSDTHDIFTDDTLLVFPHNDIICKVCLQYSALKLGVRRPHIQSCIKAAHPSNIWWSLSIPPAPHPPRLLTSEVPPHLALCTTSGKIMKAWGRIPAKECAPLRASVIERANATIRHDRPPLSFWELDVMKSTHRIWSWMGGVPPSSVSDAFDQTLVEMEGEESPVHKRKSSGGKNMDSAARSLSSLQEPKRRLLPSELQQPNPPTATGRMFPSADGDNDEDDEDEVISVDSHISGVEDVEEFTKASMARGDYEMDPKWLKGIDRWAVGTSKADAHEALSIDTQIKEDPREQPRVVTSVDLESLTTFHGGEVGQRWD
ncbi:hypothetical protein MVEN_00154600 [Mycena venus]|uniref:Uncharacterized protein n=1 Tax=Mycena venus TaxID=2733690 RepID=A0A8H6Z0E6_9AGAR|nr:hypothetical protein MVEN_00154600 [Mycena venus]